VLLVLVDALVLEEVLLWEVEVELLVLEEALV
jgi:hypothetical protein